MHYTMQGYRVIALAQRQLRRMSYVKVQRAQRDDLERQLSFLGKRRVVTRIRFRLMLLCTVIDQRVVSLVSRVHELAT